MSQPDKPAGITAAVAQMAREAVQGIANVAYSPAVQAKVAQGATEIANTLFNGSGQGYSPYTADTTAYRAQFAKRGQSRGMER
jgi:hypothetical protein